MYTTLFISKTFAVKLMDMSDMMIAAIRVTIVENILTFMGTLNEL